MNEYITVSEVAEIWRVSPRRIQILCAQGLIEGAVKFGRSWAIPRDAKRPDDHREKQFRTYIREKTGFTLIEMLVVIAIISILVSVVIPTVSNATEKSREAVDMANVRAAYAAVNMAAMSNDTQAVYKGENIYQGSGDTFSVHVPLKQQQTGWTTEAVNIAGITQGNARWIGTPQEGGTCRVYGESGKIIINWNGDAVTLNKRWTYVSNGSEKYLNSTYQDIPDGYKASVVSQMLDVKNNSVIHCKNIASAGDLLDTEKYTYSIGLFVVDASVTNGSGQYKVLRDTTEITFPDHDDKFTISENGKNMKVAIQLFKKSKDGKTTLDLTETEAAALNNLLYTK